MQASQAIVALSVMGLCFSLACKLERPNIPQSIQPSQVKYEVGVLNCDRSEFDQALSDRDYAKAKITRDRMIGLVRRDIESFYMAYEAKIASSRRNVQSIVDVAALSGVSAAVVTNGARAKTVISTMVSLLQGSQAKVDQNTFRDKTIDVIILKMRASRTRVDTAILSKMSRLDAEEYSFAEAEKDLRDFFWAGTVLAGYLEMSSDAGGDVKSAQAAKETTTIERIAAATTPQADLAKAIRLRINDLYKQYHRSTSTEADKKTVKDTVIAAVNDIKDQQTPKGDKIPPDTEPESAFRQLNALFKMATTDLSLLEIVRQALKVPQPK